MDKQRYVLLNGEKVYVSEEVYREYYRPVWRESKRNKIRKDAECSLEGMKDDGYEPASVDSLDALMSDKLLLNAALNELSDDERSLINTLFFDEQSERDLARKVGISQPAIHKRRNRILEKLKNILK